MGILTKVAVAGSLAAAVAGPAFAVAIPNGTLSLVSLASPTVTLGGSPTASFTAANTFQISGTGGFTSAAPSTAGSLNGTLRFSATEGTTVAQTGVTNFFSFTNSAGDTFRFTPLSVLTSAYSVTPGTSSSISLFLLGTTVDTLLGYDATPTSLTLSFNSTGGSAYSSSATLSIPPSSVVPEPASWALMVAGFGLVGAAARRRRTTVSAVRFG